MLIVARHDRVFSMGTESRRTVVGYEVAHAAAGEPIALDAPWGLGVASVQSHLVISEVGHCVYVGSAERFDPEAGLAVAASFSDEQLAVWLLERETGNLVGRVSEEEHAQLTQHHIARREFLVERYPVEAAAAEAARNVHPLRPMTVPWSADVELLAVAENDAGQLGVVHTSSTGRVFSVVEPSGELGASVPLSDRGRWGAVTALARGGWGVFDGGQVVGFDPFGQQMGPASRALSIHEGDVVQAIAEVDSGWLVGVVPAGQPPELWRIAVDGSVEPVVHVLAGLTGITAVVPGRDGRVFVHGPVEGDFQYDLRIDGWHKRDAMPTAVWSVSPDGTTEVVVKGADGIVGMPDGRGFWAHFSGMYSEADGAAVQHGFTAGVLHRWLVAHDLDGAIGDRLDITDPAWVGVPLKVGAGESGVVFVSPNARDQGWVSRVGTAGRGR